MACETDKSFFLFTPEMGSDDIIFIQKTRTENYSARV